MTGSSALHRLIVVASCVALTATGCSFQGLNSLALPGAIGRGADASIYHVEIANVATLESNSPVMIDDVVVGSVGKMTLRGWHADVEVSVRPDVVVPVNALATVGQTSLLGSMHLALDPPLGEAPRGRLEPGTTIALNQSSTYPSTEQTLASLSAVVNGGGLGQIGDVIHNFNVGLSGREPQVRDLLTRLDTFVGTLDRQRDNIIVSIQGLNRLAATFAGQRDVVTRALREIPPALDVLIQERTRITAALDKLGTFSRTATRLVTDTQADLVRNLQNLAPALKALADIGPKLNTALAYVTTFPYSQDFIDRAIRGDYYNLFAVIDFTIPRLKRSLLLGTRWGDENAKLVPAPGEPYYLNYTYDPLTVGVAPPPPVGAPPLPPAGQSMPPGVVAPPAPGAAPPQSPIFAGPYPTQGPPAPGAPATAGGG